MLPHKTYITLLVVLRVRRTLKDKTYHVQPPLDALNQMTPFRAHLDAASNENNRLKVTPYSHERGILK